MKTSPAAHATSTQNSRSSCAIHYTLSSHWCLNGSRLRALTLSFIPSSAVTVAIKNSSSPSLCSAGLSDPCAVHHVLSDHQHVDGRVQDLQAVWKGIPAALASPMQALQKTCATPMLSVSIALGRLCLATMHSIRVLACMPFAAVVVYMKDSTSSTDSKAGLTESQRAPATSC